MAIAVLSRRYRLAALAFLPFAMFMSNAQPAAAKAFIYCTASNAEGFNPGGNPSAATYDATHQIYDRLVAHEPGIVKLAFGLASTWDVSNDGKIYILGLRKGVKWHASATFTPTRDLNAEDVLFTFERLKASGSRAYEEAGLPKLLKSVEKADDYTLRFTLERPDAGFLATLAMDFTAIQSKEYFEQLQKAGTADKFDQMPIGTGPFVLVAHQKDKLTHFKAFPHYWRGQALVSDVVFAVEPDASARLAKLKSGDCDVMTAPNAGDLEAARKDETLAVQQIPALNIAYLAYNTQKKPFDDIRVRRAFDLAINKKAIIDAAYPAGTGVPAISPLPPAIWSYAKGLRDDPTMPSAGKKLLAEAGVAEGFATELWTGPDEHSKRIAGLLQADLAQIGVKAEIKSFPADEFTKRTRDGEHTLALMDETGGSGDPDSILNTLLGCEGTVAGGRNVARWCNDEYQRLMMQAKGSTSMGDRTGYYERAQALFKKQSPWLTIAHRMDVVVLRKAVTGYKISPFGRPLFLGVDIAK